MRRDVFVYLSGPITPKDGYTIEENVASAVRIYFNLLNQKIPCFCPHLSGAFPSAFANVGWRIWLDYDLAVIDRCTHMLMLPRWTSSTGALEEKDYAQSKGITICYSVEELVQVIG